MNKNHVEPDVYIELMKRVHHKGLFKTLFFSSGNVANRLDNKAELGLSHMTWIPHEKLKLELQNADVLLSLSQLQGKQISSKIFEYMSYGKPIFHFYYKDDDINLNYLKKYPLALLLKADCITEENVNSIEDLLIQLSWLTIAFNNLADDFKCMTPQYIVNELIK